MKKSIDDLLKMPLPSSFATVTEAPDGLEDDIDMSDIEEDLAAVDVDDVDADLDNVTLDDMADLEDATPVALNDVEASAADDNMALMATPALLKDELMDEASFESLLADIHSVIAEGFLLESDAADIFGESYDIYEEKSFASKTKVAFSEKDRRKQLFEIGVQASARSHNDPVYFKLQKVYKLERQYKAYLRQKYKGEALKRVAAYIKRLKSSGSNVLSKLAGKFKKA